MSFVHRFTDVSPSIDSNYLDHRSLHWLVPWCISAWAWRSEEISSKWAAYRRAQEMETHKNNQSTNTGSVFAGLHRRVLIEVGARVQARSEQTILEAGTSNCRYVARRVNRTIFYLDFTRIFLWLAAREKHVNRTPSVNYFALYSSVQCPSATD
jgi:hypothetical protein